MSRRLAIFTVAVFASGCGDPKSGLNTPASTPELSAPAIESSVGTDDASVTLPLSGPPRRNPYLQLAVSEAGFDPRAPKPPLGTRYFTVGLTGISRSGNDVALEIRPFVFAQNDKGCISRPDTSATWLSNPFTDVAVFTPAKPAHGQLSFLVPDDTERIRVLIAPANGDGFVVPAGAEFTPYWPDPTAQIDDGTTLRLLLLPRPEISHAVSPGIGDNVLILDIVIENLQTSHGIEFTTSQQLRLVDSSGTFVSPSARTRMFACRLDDGDLIPPGGARRFMVAYDVPSADGFRLQYRGFETEEQVVDLPAAP